MGNGVTEVCVWIWQARLMRVQLHSGGHAHVAHNKHLEHQDMRIHAGVWDAWKEWHWEKWHFYVLVDSQKCCCLLTLQTLPLPSEAKLSLALWPTISISIFIFVSGVSSLWLWEVIGCSSALTPSPLSQTNCWLSGCAGFTWRLRCVFLDVERKAKLLTPLTAGFEMEIAFCDSVLLLIAPCCSHAPLRTNTSRARSWGWHRHSERKPSATHTHISRD